MAVIVQAQKIFMDMKDDRMCIEGEEDLLRSKRIRDAKELQLYQGAFYLMLTSKVINADLGLE